MLKRMLVAAAILALAGCAVAPYKKPLPEQARAKLSQPVIYAKADDRGVGVQYFAQDNSASGAQYGLVGVLVAATLDGVLNARPMDIAQDGADKLVPLFNHSEATTWLHDGLRSHLITEMWFTDGIEVRTLAKDQKIEASAFANSTVLTVALEYSLARDLRSLQVTATAHVVSKAAAELLAKQKGATDGDKKAGRIYRNRFEYHSDPLPPPLASTQAETDARVAARVAEINAKYPGPHKPGQRLVAMRKELEAARRPTPLRDQADSLVQQWFADGGSKLTAAMRTGTATVLNLLAMDLLDSTPVDTKAKQPYKRIVEQNGNRVVVRYMTGEQVGVLSSEPRGFMMPGANGTFYGKVPRPQRTAAK